MKRHVRIYLSKRKRLEKKERREKGRVKEMGVKRGEEEICPSLVDDDPA